MPAQQVKAQSAGDAPIPSWVIRKSQAFPLLRTITHARSLIDHPSPEGLSRTLCSYSVESAASSPRGSHSWYALTPSSSPAHATPLIARQFTDLFSHRERISASLRSTTACARPLLRDRRAPHRRSPTHRPARNRPILQDARLAPRLRGWACTRRRKRVRLALLRPQPVRARGTVVATRAHLFTHRRRRRTSSSPRGPTTHTTHTRGEPLGPL
jgi:hypothetical protein